MDRDLEDVQRKAWIDRARSGDLDATEALFNALSPLVLRIARRRLGPSLRRELESTDVRQQALLQVIGSLKAADLPNDRALVAWLAGIVENVLRDRARYSRAQKRGSGSRPTGRNYQEQMANTANGSESPSQAALLAEDRLHLESALASLPKEQATVIRLRHFEGLSWEEISNKENSASCGALRMRYARALTKLAHLLGSPRGRSG